MRLPLEYAHRAIAYKWSLIEESERSNWERRDRYTGEQYCVHGVNIGTWDGPDIMCGACESGWTITECALDAAYRDWRRDRREFVRRMLLSVRYMKDDGLPTEFILTAIEAKIASVGEAFLASEDGHELLRDAYSSKSGRVS